MYGVRKDLDLAPFVGSTLNQVAIGPHDLQLHFDRADPADGSASLSIWGRFEVRDRDGSILEAGTPSDTRTRYLQDLVGTVVSSATAEPPSAIVLAFRSGRSVRVVDDTDQYESFAIEPGNVIV